MELLGHLAGHIHGALDWAYVSRTIGRVARLAPPLWVWFCWLSLPIVALILGQGLIGGDARIYSAAARAWLTGGDPWHAGVSWGNGPTVFVFFASTPPTLLFFAPFAYVADWAAAAFWIVLDAAVTVLVLRRLRMPFWWLMWPPVLDATLLGNPEPAVLGLLVLGGGRLMAVAPMLKIYALAPLAAERRWRAIAVSLGLLAVTAAIVPWQTFVADIGWFASIYSVESGPGLSATAVPILIPFTILALASMGWRRAGWLLVPALWLATHIHYAVTALPVMTPLIAWVSLLPLPGAFALAVIAQATYEFARKVSKQIESSPSARPGPATPAIALAPERL